MSVVVCKIKCPSCGGDVYDEEWVEYCNGVNKCFREMRCGDCNQKFSVEEWKKIEQTAKSKKPKKMVPAKKKKNINPGIALAVQMANADLEKSGAKRVLGKLPKEYEPIRTIVCKECGENEWFIDPGYAGCVITLTCTNCGAFGPTLRTQKTHSGSSVRNFKIKTKESGHGDA